jgi:L-ascorbate metabolism protein UlaG (beta-lactamase superfamily)
MKRLCNLIVFCLASLLVSGQRPEPDQLETTRGALTIQPIFHGSVVFAWNNLTIYVDPYGGEKAFKGLTVPDLVLITDIHGDHLNPETLNALETGKATFVVPQAVADQLPSHLKNKMIVLANGGKTSYREIAVSAIPMYNLPESPDSRHPKGRGNGYVLELGGKRIYVSGDTGDIREMRDLKNIDVAFVCMNLPYTMDINAAASAVLEFRPKIVYPYHYRGQDGLSDTETFKKTVNASDPAIDVRLKNWYPTY